VGDVVAVLALLGIWVSALAVGLWWAFHVVTRTARQEVRAFLADHPPLPEVGDQERDD
jgi:hypothetical protein